MAELDTAQPHLLFLHVLPTSAQALAPALAEIDLVPANPGRPTDCPSGIELSNTYT